MNIITVPYNSDFFYIRPDISLNRDSNDYFCPDDITGIAVAPFIYIRMDKAGKAIKAKFAQRYYSSIGYGINLSGHSLIRSDIPQSFLMANALDNTTYVSQLYNVQDFPLDLLSKALAEAGLDSIEAIQERFNNKIEQITRLCSVRTGDFIAIELTPATLHQTGTPVKFGELEFEIR